MARRYYIGPEGPRSAQLAIVAEKPGKDERDWLLAGHEGRPLIGRSGQAVDQHLLRIGTSRSEVYLTNAVKHFDDIGTPTDQDIKDEQPELFRELTSLPNLNCIVAMGKAALLSLSNFHYDEILSRRGSILQTCFGYKMVPTPHPSFYMHGEWRYRPIVEFDLLRALQESKTKERNLPIRQYYIEPTFSEAMEWIHYYAHKATTVMYDIETFYPHFISCIGFSDSPSYAHCIPIMKGNRQPYWSLDDEVFIWRGIQEIFDNTKAEFCAKNGLFDSWHLWRHGIRTDRAGTNGFDVEYAHRLLAADLPHKLEFICSIYTREPYYKDESGDWKSEVRVPDRQFWTYNCKDNAIQMESMLALKQDMTELKMLDHYYQEVHPQWPILLDMQQKGIKVSLPRLTEIREQLTSEVSKTEGKIKEAVGWIPNTKSHLQMKRLFDQYGVRYGLTKKGRVKIDEDSILLYASQSEGARSVLMDCLEITSRRTLLSGFLSMYLDPHFFYHPLYNLTHTVTGRLSSEGADEGGPQLQNIPVKIRHVFIPDDEDSEFTSVDLEQAESRIVTYDACDPLFMSAFEQGLDVHRIRGCQIFRGWGARSLPPKEMIDSILPVCPACSVEGETECTHSERYIAKRSNHAFAYKMGVRKFTKVLRDIGVFMQEKEARRIRDCIVSGALEKWQEEMYLRIRNSAWQSTPLGRKREFYGIPDEDLLRKFLSWYAQGTVSQVTNRAMIYIYPRLPKKARIVTQTHDSILLCHKKKDKLPIATLLEETFDIPITIKGQTITIPIDRKVGPSWGELQ